jgi:hypothetical protein
VLPKTVATMPLTELRPPGPAAKAVAALCMTNPTGGKGKGVQFPLLRHPQTTNQAAHPHPTKPLIVPR